MSFTAKLDLEEIAYGATGWNAIVTTNMQKIDDAVHTIVSVTAGETITSYAAVYLDTDAKYDLAQADGTQQPAIGISLEAAVLDGTFRVQRCGPLTYGSWSWTPGAVLYLDPSTPGALTETKPTSNAQVVGFAMSATKMYIWPEHTSSLTPFPSTGIEIYDTDSSHTLSLVCGSDLTADRDLTFIPGDASRTVTLSGNPTLDDWFDQAVKAASGPTFASLGITNNITVGGTVDGVDVAALKTDVDGFPDELKNLVTAEIQQLENIGSETISAAQWGYLGELDQSLITTATPTFAGIIIADGGTIGQAAGPLLTFDDSGDNLGITGANVAVGATSTAWKFAVIDTAAQIVFGATNLTTSGFTAFALGETAGSTEFYIMKCGSTHASTPDLTLCYGSGDLQFSVGNIGFGTNSFGTNADKVFAIANGTAPTTQPANIFQVWAADQAAGNSCPHIMTEGGATIKVYQEAALTTTLTTITHTAPGTPDYAIQDLTNSSPYGFVTKDEGNTVLSVIANLQTRVDELEAKLQAIGFLA